LNEGRRSISVVSYERDGPCFVGTYRRISCVFLRIIAPSKVVIRSEGLAPDPVYRVVVSENLVTVPAYYAIISSYRVSVSLYRTSVTVRCVTVPAYFGIVSVHHVPVSANANVIFSDNRSIGSYFSFGSSNFVTREMIAFHFVDLSFLSGKSSLFLFDKLEFFLGH
jgi:hypothetical protein